MTDSKRRLQWYKVAELDELPEGRVKSATCAHRTVCVTHHNGTYAALDDKCPHQGGPLGEGSIENGLLRCPWHGWDFDPLTGKPPGGYDDGVPTFPTEVRDDGVYVGVEEEAPHQRTVSDVMCETLSNWNVRWVFGMVGHSNLGLADGVRRLEEAGKMRFFGIRHEGAAAFATSAYGKLTGRAAACLAIAGPGATNLLTGLWDANVDRAPAIALTGQVDTQVLGPGAFQEIDQPAAFGKVAQFSQTVLSSSRHAELVNLACKSAILNRGVSHLIFPDEVQVLPAASSAKAGGPGGRLALREIAPPAGALSDAMDRIRASKRPVIIVGHGARFDMPAAVALAEKLRAPIVTTFKGKGLVPDTHPHGCGVLGRSGTPIASWFMNESDLLIVLGASFSNHTGITPKKPTIQIDYDPIALGKFHSVDVPVWGEISATVDLILEELEDRGKIKTTNQLPEIAERWKIWRAEKARRRGEGRGQGLTSAGIFHTLSSAIPDDAIICVDVGNNTYSFGRYFECEHQSVLMSGYLGSIGFALPAAIGAWCATQEDDERFAGRKVVSVSGDGGLGQYAMELTTLAKYGMDITHIVLNNSELGKISKEQRAGAWDVWQTSLKNPSFAKMAELCGVDGQYVSEQNELEGAVRRAIEMDGPALVEIESDVGRI